MKRVTGTYSSGKVLLDERVDWPNGMHVTVDADPSAQDRLVDGSVWQEGPEATKRWLEWFDSLEPVFSPEEAKQFDAELARIRSEQKLLLPMWEKKVDDLQR